MAKTICEAVKQGIVNRRGHLSIEWYKDGKPQYYCYGYLDAATDELLEVCRKCIVHADRAQEDLEKSRNKKIKGKGQGNKMEWWQEQMLEEYKEYLHEKKEQDYAYQCERVAPHVIHNAQVIQEGNQWCCMLGDLPTGVVGFGDTPKKACAEFDRVWREGK